MYYVIDPTREIAELYIGDRLVCYGDIDTIVLLWLILKENKR